MLGVGADGVTGGHGEIGWKLIEGKPLDLARFPRLAVDGLAGKDLAEVSG